MIFLLDAVIKYRWRLGPILSHFNIKFVVMPDWLFWLILYNVFGEGSNSAHLSERIADLIMISEEHCKNDKILFQSVKEQMESIHLRVRAMHITCCFCDFCLWKALHDENKRDVLVQEKICNSIYW